MVGRQKPPTKDELRRYHALQELGCIACRINGVSHGAIPEIHHLVEGNKRLGNDYTIPLCAWHHRGEAASQWEKLKGPSLARSKREFIAEYGTERELLDAVNKIIERQGLQL